VRGFTRDLENIADILKLCVPPAAVEKEDKGNEWPCPVHGNRSVGDPGLAHQLVGRLGLASREYSSLVVEAGGRNGGGGSGAIGESGGRSLVDMLVGSIRRRAVAPWLQPVNRGHFEVNRRGLSQVIREEARRCLSFVHGNAAFVAVAGRAVISVFNLESWDLIQRLYAEGAGWIGSIAVAGEGCGVKPEGVTDIVPGVWLAAGHDDGSVRIWDLETERCVTTLHPMVVPHSSYSRFGSYSRCISMAPDRRRVVHFAKPDIDNQENGELHVCDLSSDGTQERYVFVHGCQNSLGFEVASAALLYQDESKRSSVEQCRSRTVRFERCLESDKKMKYFSYSGRGCREGGPSGYLTSKEETDLSEATDSLVLMRVEVDFVAKLAESDYMRCCRVANCDDRVLVAAVNNWTDSIMVLDTLSSEIVNELCFTEDDVTWSIAAVQGEAGRVLVVTGDFKGMIRLRVADSGELIGQWQALREGVNDVAIAVKAGMAMGAYGSSGLWLWSFGDEWPGSDQSKNSPASADALPQPRATGEALILSNHSQSIHSIAFG
jgi:WD40 repeat protein